MLKIDRSKDSRVIKAITQRIMDIPGGVTVSVATLGGASLKEGTPIGAPATDTGLCKVVKTAKFAANAANDALSYDIEKGSHFKVGDYISTGAANGKAIATLDKTSSALVDTFTVAVTLGVAVTAGDVAIQVTGANKTLAVSPVAIVGSNYDVTAAETLAVDAWQIAQVKEASAPPMTTTLKALLLGVFYI